MTIVGTVELVAKINTSQYKKGAADIEKTNSDMESSGTRSGSRLSSGFTKLAKIGLAAVAAAAVAAGAAIVSNIGKAVSRVDTLNNFPKVMQNLGYGADEARRAINTLDKGVQGLPTSLDSIASAMQNIAPSTSSLSQATKLTLALNNALIAGGKPAEIQASAMEQFSQAIAKGKPDLMEWRSIATAMPGQMKQLANSLGYKQWQDMAQAVTDGDISFSKVTRSLVKLNEKGLGKFPSFADQAKNAAGGIGTSFTQMNTAITRGIGKVITAIGSKNISNAITGIGNALEGVLGVISSVIGYLPTLASWFEKNKTAIQNIAIVIGTLLLPMLVQLGVQGVRNIILYTAATIAAGVQSLIAGARMAAGWLLAMGPIGLIIAAVVGAVALIIANWDSVRGFVSNVWTKIKGAAVSVFNWLKKNWPLVLAIITGPIGLAVLAIVKNFSKIKSAVGNVWNWIKTTLGTIGKVAANIIKVPVNAILGFAQNTINGFIRALNGVIDIINKIPKVHLGKIGQLKLPRLAEGGIVTSPTIAEIGEGGEPEAVIPLSKLDKMIKGNDNSNNQGKVRDVTYNVYPKSEIDMNVINRQFLWELNRA